eukprot:TRINITY_DN541_c0_g1_i1.p3 TRINITY_DN541_c0_g1~~TRINITY_DN541_c0_g1_i1.p3  ORF type:complete len:111 (-),score=21.99 TRINITY_DN541_c0_g1_i1:676-1008(-)
MTILWIIVCILLFLLTFGRGYLLLFLQFLFPNNKMLHSVDARDAQISMAETKMHAEIGYRGFIGTPDKVGDKLTGLDNIRLYEMDGTETHLQSLLDEFTKPMVISCGSLT